jgi:hypothetical protein
MPDRKFVAVYAQRPGVRGFDAMGNDIEIKPGTVRWILEEEVDEKVADGSVQLAAGLNANRLPPVGGYSAAVIAPSKAEPPDEPRPKRRGRPPGSRTRSTYKRSDIVAEDAK